MTYIILHFQIKYCSDLGIPAGKSSTLYLFTGIFGALGRLGGGFLCDVKYINTIRLFQGVTLIVGASTMLLSLAQTYAAVAVYAIVFSMADGILVSTFTVKCMEVVDEESKKASMVGYIILAAAGFLLSAPPSFGECDVIQESHVQYIFAGDSGAEARGNRWREAVQEKAGRAGVLRGRESEEKYKMLILSSVKR